MKRLTFLLLALVATPYLFSQSYVDALRYSKDHLNGTARFVSMSGAFGALGGDLSSIKINPAGSAVFLNNSASVSFSVHDTQNETSYFNNNNSFSQSDFSVNQAGGVFVFENSNVNSNWKKFTLGLNYDVQNNFDNAYFVSGTSNRSIDSYFLGYAEGVSLDLLQLQSGESISSLYKFLGENEGFGAQQAFLGFQSFIIDPVDFENPNNTSYFSNIEAGAKNQEYSEATSGYNAKFTINLGTQLHDNLYMGVNLNSHIIDYREATFFVERNSIPTSLINEVRFSNNLAVLGDGFSAQLGLILKATPFFRFGLTYDTPTWFNILEETTQSITTLRTVDGQNISENIQPNVINIFEEYRLRSPGKIAASVAYLFGKQGLISVDYGFKDFSNMQFSPTTIAAFSQQNNEINSLFKSVSIINIGGEYRLQPWSLRGGIHYEESPFKDQLFMDDLLGFSVGLGYDFGALTLDLAYARSEQQRQEQFYQNSAFNNASLINATNNLFTLSTTFKF